MNYVVLNRHNNEWFAWISGKPLSGFYILISDAKGSMMPDVGLFFTSAYSLIQFIEYLSDRVVSYRSNRIFIGYFRIISCQIYLIVYLSNIIVPN